MTYISETLETPVVKEVDVLVVGAGPAGSAAALSSARQGVETMVIEQTGALGGIATSGLMSHWTGSVDSEMYRELLKNSTGEGEANSSIINPERLKISLLKMMNDANVKVQLYTFASSVIMEGNRVTGIVTESKSGREAILAKTVIDASGDGDIAAKAGVPFQKGRESDQKMQPVTIMFKVGGVNYEEAVFLGSFESTYQTDRGELQALAKQHIPFPAGHVLLYRSTLPGVVTCNMTNCINIDGTNAADLTRAEYVCRSQMDDIVTFLKEFVPGYENCYIISSASLVGIRETRHFEGLYTLTEQDILNQRVFEDWVVKGANFNFDVHNIEGAGLDKTGKQKHFPAISGYTIPYRCLVPKQIDGLLLAGRNISGTHMAHSSYRAMPICAAMGEGAGIAAALAVKNGIKVRDVETGEIRKILQ